MFADILGKPHAVCTPHLAQGHISPMLKLPKILHNRDENYLINGYLEKTLDWISCMKDIRLRDTPSFIRTTNPDDYMIKFGLQETERSKNASAVIVNTFEPLEREVVESLQTLLPLLYVIVKHVEDKNLEELGSNLWEED
ncbi:hypothetical protein HAX54_017535 [Datura stramonium]|uniref:Uncharacterized protein n=1 Tax=Datura stramonium TaxID=4076 RepID=A0ABS8UN54_DATST|nr:hypothetical protein [Datura stramonium]